MVKFKQWLWVVLLGGGMFGLGCQGNGQAAEAEWGVPSDFAGKNPSLPAAYVDTTGSTYAWHTAYNRVQSVGSRIEVPEGFRRPSVEKGSFGHWLRGLPLKPGRPEVHLYDGSLKGNQEAHHAVVDMDVGHKDLQQCADAVMRLRAEYLFTQGAPEDIHFNFTSGERADWSRWTEGYRPKFYKQGNKWQVTWKKSGQPGDGHAELMAYLEKVYTWAGTASLEREMEAVDIADLRSGDVFIQGGFPGHAVIVVDVAESTTGGGKAFLLAQSYMPAQEMHLLRNPAAERGDPWFRDDFGAVLDTPEWAFEAGDLHRFR